MTGALDFQDVLNNRIFWATGGDNSSSATVSGASRSGPIGVKGRLGIQMPDLID